MDWEAKAALTAAAVLIVMVVVRWGGRRLGGLAAALPTITAPTLAWLAENGGVGFAVEAAVGSVAACAMLAAFALCYAHAARVGNAVWALGAGLAGAGLLALPAQWASSRPTDAIVMAFGVCALAWVTMPDARSKAPSAPTRLASMLLVVAVAAVASVAAASIGPSIGGFATGLLSSLPLITGAVAMAEHSSAGHRAAGRFLAGYVGGLFGKAVFGFAFATLAPRLGAPMALLLGCAAAAVLSAVQISPAALKVVVAPAP